MLPPLTVAAVTESGKELQAVRDKDNILCQLAQAASEADVAMLRHIDPWGDTIFNRLQLRIVIQELDVLAKLARNESETALIAEVRGLAIFCQEKPHRYLKIFGA